MFYFKYFAILLFFSLQLLDAKVLIRFPEVLKESFDKINGIDYYIVNAKGLSPKKNFVGTLIFQKDNEDGCQNVKSLSSGEYAAYASPILVFTHKGCLFEQKAKNAELAGAKMVMILNNEDHKLNHQYHKAYTYPVSIETMVIAKKDADVILDYLKKTSLDSKEGFYPAEITYTFEENRFVYFPVKTEKVTIDYWIATSDIDGNSYAYLKEIANTLPKFKDRVEFNLHYMLWEDEFSKEEISSPRCLSGAHYCDPEPMDGRSVSGKESVLESLRQICLSKQTTQDIFLNYVQRFADSCLSLENRKIDVDQCREEVYRECDIYENTIEEVNACMRNSFEGDFESSAKLEDLTLDNNLLRNELQLQRKLKITHYPSLYANNGIFIDSQIIPRTVHDFICNRFKENTAPEICARTPAINANRPNRSKEPSQVNESNLKAYIFVVIISSIIMLALVLCVRGIAKKQVMTQMDKEISDFVSVYTKIKEVKEENA